MTDGHVRPLAVRNFTSIGAPEWSPEIQKDQLSAEDSLRREEHPDRFLEVLGALMHQIPRINVCNFT